MPGIADLLALGAAPPGAPGAPMGPPGGPDAGMQALLSLQKTPPGKREKDALQESANGLGVALQGLQLQNPKAAKLVADGLAKIQAALQAMAEESMAPVGAPPMLAGESGPPAMMAPGGMA